MSLEYAAYLALTFCGALALAKTFRVRIDFRKAAIAIVPVVVLFYAWDSAAAAAGWWSFGMEHMLGVLIGNQPLEEVLFFAVIPFFYIVSWEILKAREAKKVR